MATKKLPEGEHALRLRIVIEDPVPGVLHSLQDAKNVSVAAQRASEDVPLTFEFEVCAKATDDGVGSLDEHVRRDWTELAPRLRRERQIDWRRGAPFGAVDQGRRAHNLR